MVRTMAMLKKNKNETANLKQNKPQNDNGNVKKQKIDTSANTVKYMKAKENLMKSQISKLSTSKVIKGQQLEQKNTNKKLLKNIPTKEEKNSESDDQEMIDLDSDDEEEMNNSDDAEESNKSDDEEEVTDSDGEENEEMNSSDGAEEEKSVLEIRDSAGRVETKQKEKNRVTPNNEDEGIIIPRSDGKNSDSNNTSKGRQQHRLPEYKLMINNLPMDTTFSDLFKLLSDCGSITNIVLNNPKTFECGFKATDSLRGKIIFKSIDSLDRAMQYNETEFKGRQISTRTIKPQERHQNGNSKQNIQRKVTKIRFQPSVTVYVKNIRQGTNNEQIKQFFSSCGQVTDIQLKGNGQAFVRFAKTESIPLALSLNNTTLNGSNVWIIRYKNFNTPPNAPKFGKSTPSLNPMQQYENNLMKKIENRIMLNLQNQRQT